MMGGDLDLNIVLSLGGVEDAFCVPSSISFSSFCSYASIPQKTTLFHRNSLISSEKDWQALISSLVSDPSNVELIEDSMLILKLSTTPISVDATASRFVDMKQERQGCCVSNKSICCSGKTTLNVSSSTSNQTSLFEPSSAAIEKLQQASTSGSLNLMNDCRQDSKCCSTSSSLFNYGTKSLIKEENPNQSQYAYRDPASLRACTLNFGGVGSGCVSIGGDGGLRQWQINNVVNHNADVPNSFFGIRCITKNNVSTSNVLLCNATYDQTDFVPAPQITDHVVPPSAKLLLKSIPQPVKSLEIIAKFPNATINYTTTDVPVKVSMDVSSPFIPLNSKDSCLPVVFFTFNVTNPTSDAVTVSLMQSQQNIIGWDGYSAITGDDLVSNANYGGNINTVLTVPGCTAISMTQLNHRDDDQFFGNVAIGVLSSASDSIFTLPQYQSVKDCWNYFTGNTCNNMPVLPGCHSEGPSAPTLTYNGAIATSFLVQPNSSHQVTFFLVWHFPNRRVTWNQIGVDNKFPHDFWIGNAYANFWPSLSKDLIPYVVSNASCLLTDTALYCNTFFDSTLPWYILESCMSRGCVLRSPTYFYTYDLNMYCFEGCSNTQGCCPLNCTHVLDYAFGLARLFPDLEQSMRHTDLQVQIAPNGIIPSRTNIPEAYVKRQWSMWPNYTDIDPSDCSICVDGEICTVLKLYREVLYGAPDNFFINLWPQAKKILNRWLSVMDNGQGVVSVPQPSTYDCALYGVNSFVTMLYHCALRAGEEMAILMNEPDIASTYHTRFQLGVKTLDAMCFTNNKWYTHVLDPMIHKNELGDGSFIDATLGEWWCGLLDLGNVGIPDHVKSSLSATFTNNHRTSFDPKQQYPRVFLDERDAGTYICRWVDTPPRRPMLYTSEATWSGVEYPFIMTAMRFGLTDIYETMLNDLRHRHDGTRRSPWNEIECGDYYSRQLAGSVLVDAASGCHWNSIKKSISFSPCMQQDSLKCFYSTSSGWGQLTINNGSTVSLSVAWGTLSLNMFSCSFVGTFTKASISINGAVVVATIAVTDNVVSATFGALTVLKAGDVLTVQMMN